MIDAVLAPSGLMPRGSVAGCVGLAAVLVALALPFVSGRAQAAPPSSPAASAPRGTATPAPRASEPSSAPRGASAPDPDVGSRNVAARARMSECGHQWNNMKRTGTATGTWKEFSRNCLAQK